MKNLDTSLDLFFASEFSGPNRELQTSMEMEMEMECPNAPFPRTTSDTACSYRDCYDVCQRPIGSKCELDKS